MVRKYFLNSVSEAAVTTCSGNPFHKSCVHTEIVRRNRHAGLR